MSAVASITSSWPLKNIVLSDSFKDIKTRIILRMAQAASYLTDPICKAHELATRFRVVDALYPSANKVNNFLSKAFLLTGAAACLVLATTTTLPGIILRSLANNLQQESFLYRQGKAPEQTIQHGQLSLLSWNVCLVNAGYSITDGGVTPWAFRIDNIVKKIKEENADVVSLYEVFDINAARYMQAKLEQQYTHFYYHMGSRAIGVSSGLFIASKMKVNNPEFISFSQDMLDGRAKSCGKGFFSFDIQNAMRVVATHMQHSEVCTSPTSGEVEARSKEMSLIMDKVNQVVGKAVIVTGDLNLDDREYSNSTWHTSFKKGDEYHDPIRTWGGDQFCAILVNKPISGPLNLDHTMLKVGSARSIKTSLIETGYNAGNYNASALSDHRGLYSTITI